ncbi:hypothetical protein B0A55_08989, partial [Friedmanniomyces simplex]
MSTKNEIFQDPVKLQSTLEKFNERPPIELIRELRDMEFGPLKDRIYRCTDRVVQKGEYYQDSSRAPEPPAARLSAAKEAQVNEWLDQVDRQATSDTSSSADGVVIPNPNSEVDAVDVVAPKEVTVHLGVTDTSADDMDPGPSGNEEGPDNSGSHGSFWQEMRDEF